MKKSAVLISSIFFTFLADQPLMADGLDNSDRYTLSTPLDFSGKPASGRPGGMLVMERNTGRKENYPGLDIVAGGGRHRLSFSYHGGDYSRSFMADGQTDSFDEEILTGLIYDVYDFIYQYDVIRLKNSLAGFTVGVTGQVRLMEGQAELQAAGRRHKENFNASIPLIGLNLHMGILGDLLEGRVRAAGINYNHGNIFDGQAEIALYPYPFLDIYGGYRFYFIDIETDDAKLDHDKSGPYLGLTFSF